MKQLGLMLIIIGLLLTLGCTSSESKPTFILNDDEQAVYEALKQNHDDTILQELEPISVAKLYVMALYEYEHDVGYTLYTQREGHVLWTREEDQHIPFEHHPTKEQVINTFNNIETGVFIQTDEYSGFIEYINQSNEKAHFSMIRDENDSWKVAFMPIQ